ncbi:MAG: acyltransferase family protein [Gammaproteobacteria bacterium]
MQAFSRSGTAVAAGAAPATQQPAAMSAAIHGAHGAQPYRPDIDGLRAVAVLLVVVFHAWPRWLQSGFIGVDIFFVISGFLITSIILSDLQARSFSILEFYSRRVRRIYPALLLVMFVTLALGWAVLMRNELAQLGKHIASGAAFIANLTFWSETGYFDNNSTTKPLLHLWSLGVEEQFYIVWPLLLWLSYRFRTRFLKPALVIFAVSFAYSLYATYHSPTEGYFSPVTRFWELMVGGICAHVQRHHIHRLARWSGAMAFAGVGALLLAGLLVTEQTAFPGWWALAPVLGASLLILAGSDAWINRRVLAQPLAVQLGLVSYPFYLWHWPLLSFTFILYGEKPPALVKLAAVAGSLLLAFLTYRLLELPLKRRVGRGLQVRLLCALMVVAGGLGLLMWGGQLAPRLQTNGADRYLNALNDLGFPTAAMRPLSHAGVTFQQVVGRGQGTTVLLGDSVVEQYGVFVTEFLKAHPEARRAVVFGTAGGCPPIEGAVRLPQIKFSKCTQTVHAALHLALSTDVDTVLVGGAWYGYFNRDYTDLIMDGRQFPDTRAQEAAFTALENSLARLRAAGKRVFLLMTPPAGAAFDPRAMVEGSRLHQIRPKAHLEPFDARQFNEAHQAARARLQGIAATTGATLIDPIDTLCPQLRCPVVDANGEPKYTDTVHMRPGVSLSAARYLEPALRPPSVVPGRTRAP